MLRAGHRLTEGSCRGPALPRLLLPPPARGEAPPTRAPLPVAAPPGLGSGLAGTTARQAQPGQAGVRGRAAAGGAAESAGRPACPQPPPDTAPPCSRPSRRSLASAPRPPLAWGCRVLPRMATLPGPGDTDPGGPGAACLRQGWPRSVLFICSFNL